MELYHNLLSMEKKQDQYRSLLDAYRQIEEADKRFIGNTMQAVAEKKVLEIDISSLLLVNRLFTQACRMQIYSLKDLLLTQDLVRRFDRAMDAKETMGTEQKEAGSK